LEEKFTFLNFLLTVYKGINHVKAKKVNFEGLASWTAKTLAKGRIVKLYFLDRQSP
jgi:hypothetical protein